MTDQDGDEIGGYDYESYMKGEHNDEKEAFTNAFNSIASHDDNQSEEQIEVAEILVHRMNSSNMRVIDMPGEGVFRLNDAHIAHFVEALFTSAVNLEYLSLKYHHIGSAGTVDICRLLNAPGSHLSTVILEGNEIGVHGATAIKEALLSPSCPLSALNISWNFLTPEGGHELAAGLQTNESLRSFKASNCGFNYGSVVALCTNIAINQNIEEVELDRPILGKFDSDICIDHMSKSLLNHRGVRSLSLQYFGITDHGTSLLAETFWSRIQICHLNLASNSICIKGAEFLSSFIVQSKTIKSVNISNNSIMDEGALALSKALLASKSLNKLSLKNCRIGEKGLISIGQSLYTNRHLRDLQLWGNTFSDSSAHLYFELNKNRFPTTSVRLDFQVYVVDDAHLVAEVVLAK